jgi:hypothetical protein
VPTKPAVTAEIKAANIERMRTRMLAIVGPKAEAMILKANELSAKQFAATVRRAIPRGDPKGGELVNTIVTEQPTRVGVSVSIGNPEVPYPLHLETGHRARDGTHVPGKAYWFPAKQVTKKSARNRVLRAERAAIKLATSGGSSDV